LKTFTLNADSFLQTCLPPGRYCDVITGKRAGNFCTGKTIEVDILGDALIELPANDINGVLAIHAGVEVRIVDLNHFHN
jgi:hypothetical protein